MVHNRNSKSLRISEIGLKDGANSIFLINVNGATDTNNRFRDIEISARDSMHIFVAVNIAELGQDAPLFIEDHLFFNTNGAMQQIVLETYGQDVEILRRLTIQNDTTLTANKPYIIYGYLAIVPEKTLTLAPGSRLFFHNNADLIVYGNLVAEGTAEDTILLRGNRFDSVNFSRPIPYNFIAGQWGGLYLFGNGNHRLKHVIINSGHVGIYLSANTNSPIPDPNEMPTLELANSKIHNFLFYGLVAENAHITVANSEISNTGSYTVYLNGGNHTFVHTTIANYFNSGASAVQPRNRDSSEPAVMIMNLNRSSPMKTMFLNSVIAGSVDTEFSLATRFPSEYNGIFRNTYIKRSPLGYFLFQETDTIRWHERGDIIFKSTNIHAIRVIRIQMIFQYQPHLSI